MHYLERLACRRALLFQKKFSYCYLNNCLTQQAIGFSLLHGLVVEIIFGAMKHAVIKPEEIASILQKELAQLRVPVKPEEVGTVLQIGDGVAHIYGLEHVQAGELVVFEDETQGIVLNLEEDHVSAMILGKSRRIREGDVVKRTNRIGSIKVGKGLLGRVVDALGMPIDGKGPIVGKQYELPIERKAPGVIYRETVRQPLYTGIKSIDAMIPIGRGQRELIIGDRQTGKTTIAIDTIINQRELFEQGKPVYCIYVAIGKKASSIAQVVDILHRHRALDYTIVVAASASSPAVLQFLAPFAGTTMGEFFREMGQHALIVYDDLSQQAVAHREISLLTHRPPGREAYSGDVFYVHARLLERPGKIIAIDRLAQQMNDLPEALQAHVKGGGSLTALPIIETQDGDVSAYIPTNVISITDGQLFLDTGLFNTGIRPAINVGISVSRVGGAAQIKAMKRVAGTLKLDQAQFSELASFAKFGTELDPVTHAIIQRGRNNQELLKQLPHQPMSVGRQIAMIYLATGGYLDELALTSICSFQKRYLALLAVQHKGLLQKLEKGILNESTEKDLAKIAQKLIKDMQRV